MWCSGRFGARCGCVTFPGRPTPTGYGAEITPERRERLEEINAIREKVRLPLLPLYENMKSPSAAADKAAALYRFARQAGVPQLLGQQAQALMQSGRVQTAEEYRQLWEIFCTVLDQFAEILGDTALTGEEFCRMLRLVLTQYSVGTIPATLDQVKVSEMTRADRRTVRALFLLGCNDHLLPGWIRRGAFWTAGTGPFSESVTCPWQTPPLTSWIRSCRIFTPRSPGPRSCCM